MTDRRIVRWSEVLCGSCQAATVDRFFGANLLARCPGRPSYQQVVNSCEACGRAFAQLQHGVVIRTWPTLPGDMVRRMNAVHEAGHAVLGVVTGQPLKRVVLAADPGVHPGGLVEWDGSYTVLFEDYAGMCWAGQQAVLRWLGERELTTPENVLDARYAGFEDVHQATELAYRVTGDTAAAVEAVLGWRDLADGHLARHWAAVGVIASELLVHGQLSADHVSGLVTARADHR